MAMASYWCRLAQSCVPVQGRFPSRPKRELNTGHEVVGQWPVECLFLCSFLVFLCFFVKKCKKKNVSTGIYFLVYMGLHPCFW